MLEPFEAPRPKGIKRPEPCSPCVVSRTSLRDHLTYGFMLLPLGSISWQNH